MIALVVSAMLADLLTFAAAVPVVGIAAESNPIMAAGYVAGGLGVVVALKTCCTIAILAALTRIRRRPLRRLTAIFAASIALLGVLGNVTA
jgi:hypothetical protein